MTLQELLDTIKQLDEQAIELRKQLSEYTFKKIELEQKVKDYETDIKYRVLVENDIPENVKLSNAEQRKVYIDKTLKDDKVYQDLKQQLFEIERDIESIRIEIAEIDAQYAYYVYMLNFGIYEDTNGEEDYGYGV